MRFKRLVASVCIAGTLFAGTTTCAFAYTEQQNTMAQELNKLGLFQGKGEDKDKRPIFDLDKTATRDEAITMLIRLLGEETVAKSSNYSVPFNDVESWAVPYVGYAYQNKLASGVSTTKFGGKNTVNAKQYITFVLRALGYTEGIDFQYASAWNFSDQIGLTSGQYNENTKSFTRGDIVSVSYNALTSTQKNGSALIKTLCDKHAVETGKIDSIKLAKAAGLVTLNPPKNLKIVKQNARYLLTWEDDNTSDVIYQVEATSDLNTDFHFADVVSEKKSKLPNDLYNFKAHAVNYIRVQAYDYNQAAQKVYRSDYSEVIKYNPTGYAETLPSLSIRDVSMQIADYVSAALEADKDMLGLCQKAELATSETAALNYARQAQDKASDAGYNLDRAIDLCEYFSEYSAAKAKLKEIDNCHAGSLNYIDSSNYQTWLHTIILNCNGMGQKYDDATSMLLSGYLNYVSNHK